jgi:preprotein translocase subunit SecG
MHIVLNILMVLQILSALALIGIIMSQATKSEGLSGTIGGKAQSVFRGKPGLEEKLGQITKISAVTFMLMSALVAIFQARVGS